MILGARHAAAADEGQVGRRWLPIDYTKPTALDVASLRGVDVIVNAVGIFAERADASFHALHVNGPCNLFALAAQAGVRRVLQISALGAATDAPTAYLRSKAQGDACAAAFPGEAIIVRPSLVFSPRGASSQLFLRLATLRWLPLPEAAAPVQPLHLDDLVDGLAALVGQPDPPRQIDAVGPAPLGFGDYLRTLGRSLGHAPRILPLPGSVTRMLSAALARLPGSLLSPDALTMLARGNYADLGPWQHLLGRPPRPPERFIAPAQAAAVRREAVLANLLPLLRLSLSVTWLVTAWVSAFVYPRAASLALLERAHTPAIVAPLALYGAAALDALLGLAMWLPRGRAAVYRVQLALIGFYTAIISLWLPEYWAHPYGPVLKNLPMLALIYALLRLEPHRGGLLGHRRR